MFSPLAIIMTLSVVLRLVILFVSPMYENSKYEQVVIAENLINGHGFAMAWPYNPIDSSRRNLWESDPTPHPSAFMPPFVPGIQAAIFAVTGANSIGVYVLLVAQCIIGALIPLFVFRIAKRLSDDNNATIAALASVLYVPGLVSSATPAGALWYTLAGLFALDIAQETLYSPKKAFSLGIALGTLALMRSEFLAIGCALAAIPLLRRWWRTTLITFFGIVLIVSPWLVRNYTEFGVPVGIISHPWREIWRGANEYATGGGYTADGKPIWEGPLYPTLVRRLDSVPVTPRYELDVDNVYKDEVLSFITSNPMRWTYLTAKKTIMLWTVDPYYPTNYQWLYWCSSLLTSSMILVGVGFAVRTGRRKVLFRHTIYPLLLTGAALTVLFAITYVMPRYQTYVFTLMMPFIACIPWNTLLPKKWRLVNNSNTVKGDVSS